MDLPGFRFHPTEEELLDFYLKQVVHGKKLTFDIIGTLNLYRHDPWELPGLAKIGEREWYFFVRRDRKNSSGGRPNRTTERGFWKATGSDRPIRSVADPKRLIGLKKTLVFYQGRAPRGSKTDWVMNEYRLPDTCSAAPPPKEDMVLCKIYRKATSLKELEQRAAMEEDARASQGYWPVDSSAGGDTLSWSDQENFQVTQTRLGEEERKIKTMVDLEKEVEVSSDPAVDSKPPLKRILPELEVQVPNYSSNNISSSSLAVDSKPPLKRSLPELEVQVPNYSSNNINSSSLDWMQDPFLTQLRSPWFDHWSPYAHVLNF